MAGTGLDQLSSGASRTLSNGQASGLLWSRLQPSRTRAVNANHDLTGPPALAPDAIKTFRQFASTAPGPEQHRRSSGAQTRARRWGRRIATSAAMALAHESAAGRSVMRGTDARDGASHRVARAAAHGDPLGEEDLRLTRRAYGGPEGARFLVPEGARRSRRRTG